MKKVFMICMIIVMLFALLTTSVIAHNGRTDSRGGHNDNKNASGLGGYHYHCGDNPAHLHTNGVCPYANKSASSGNASTSNNNSSSSSSSGSSSSSDTSSPTQNSTVAAKSVIPEAGDVLGNVLYSDIKAYINGYEIPSYNIDGNTMIEAEELANYGFNVTWDGANRTLKIEIDSTKTIKPISAETSANKVGTVRCNYVYTDIKTYVANAEVKGYNINGRTIIQFDELGTYGTIKWDGTTKEIRFTSN